MLRTAGRGVLAEGEIVSDRYRVLRCVGAGAYGTVYEVEHIALHRRFALKVLNAQARRNWRSISRFEAEAVTASKIDHPNIVSVIDVGQTASNQAYYVMELLEGQTLAAVLRQAGRLSLSRAIPILAATSHGLHAAHEAGVVHRDLKPENIFLVPQEDVQLGVTREVVRILDFGLAKVLEAPTVTVEGITYGTPGYMAPEQIRGEDVDRRADIYSIGCIAYEMFAGRPLFAGEPLEVALAHIEQEAPELTAAPSPRMGWLVSKCLHKNPDDRFETCRELLEELRSIAIELLTPDGKTRTIDFASSAELPLAARESFVTLSGSSENSWWDEFDSIARRMETDQIEQATTPPPAPSCSGPTIVATRSDESEECSETLVDERTFEEICRGRGEDHRVAVPPQQVDHLPDELGDVAPFNPFEPTLQVEPAEEAGSRASGWQIGRAGWQIGRAGWAMLIGAMLIVLVLLVAITYQLLGTARATGALVVNVDPGDAVVQLDGRPQPGDGVLRLFNDLPAREVVVSASRDRCEPAFERVAVDRGRVKVVALKLECK